MSHSIAFRRVGLVGCLGMTPARLVILSSFATLVASLLQGCTTGCLGYCSAGVTLRVIDRATADPLCDALVVMDTGSEMVTIGPNPTADAQPADFCRFPVACSGAGTYQFHISKPGYRTENTTVMVPGHEGCPTGSPQHVTVELSRE